MRTALLAAGLTLGLAAAALGAEPAVVVLADGQTIEGRAEIRPDGAVKVELAGPEGQPPLEVLLAPEAVVRIEPLGGRKEDAIERGVVTLTDGRELRGRVVVRPSEVLVTSELGRVVVSRHEVERVVAVLPEPPRVALDADLGLALRVPDGWEPDQPVAVGERLRLIHREGRAWISLLVRPAPALGDALERVRGALADDLSTVGRVLREEGGDGFRVTDRAVDPAAGDHPLRVSGQAVLRDDLVVWLRAVVDDGAAPGAGEEGGPVPAEELTAQAARIVQGARFLRAGVAAGELFFRDPALRLLVSAPLGFRVGPGREEGVLAEVRSPEHPGARLAVRLTEGVDAEAALRERLTDEPEQVDTIEAEGTALVRAQGPRERGLAYALGDRTVVVTARAPEAAALSLLTAGVALIDPQGPSAEAAAAAPLAAHRAQARLSLSRGQREAAQASLTPVLEAYPEDPESLGLVLASLDPEEDPAERVTLLDAVWVSTGAPWVAEELAGALLEAAHASVETDYVAAAAAYERAALVWPSREVWAEVMDFFLGAARAAYEAGDDTQAWARFARVREAIGSWAEIDDAEAALRLKEADVALREENPQRARREARRAYILGAETARVDAIYMAAERLEAQLAAKADAARRARRRGGGFSFGIPPSRTGQRSRFVRPSTLSNPNRGSRRVRATAFTQERRSTGRYSRPQTNRGSRFVRPPRPRSGTRRVRTNGRLVFQSSD